MKEARKRHNVEIICVRPDLSQPDGGSKLVDAAIAHFASSPVSSSTKSFQIDILVNNAGVCPALLVPDCTVAEFDYTYKVNVLGPLLVLQAALPYLPHDRTGRVINISSVSANVGTPGQSIYGGTKAALDAMTRTWARELGERTTVNSLHVGPILTDMVPAPFVAKVVGFTNRNTPLATPREGIDTPQMLATAKTIGGRIAYAEEVSEVVAHLSMPEVGWITGHVVGVDGGFDFIR